MKIFAYLKISTSTLYLLGLECKSLCQKICHLWRFQEEDIDRWLEEMTVSLKTGWTGKRVMAAPLAEQVLQKIGDTRELYYRLILVVGPAGSGKTSSLQMVAAATSASLVNVNLELSRRMLDLSERQRALHAPRLLGEIVGEATGELVLLDNIEILFDVQLKHDPLRLLQRLSRNKTIIAAWNGSIVDGHITYAIPNHPEYRRYPIGDFLVASPEVTTKTL